MVSCYMSEFEYMLYLGLSHKAESFGREVCVWCLRPMVRKISCRVFLCAGGWGHTYRPVRIHILHARLSWAASDGKPDPTRFRKPRRSA